MLRNEDVATLSTRKDFEGAINSIYENRMGLSPQQGTKLLAEFFISAGLFSKIDPDDKAAIGAHNHAVELADILGLFTEKDLPQLLAGQLNKTPLQGYEIPMD